MRYWLFYVMPDVPKSWSAMVRHCIAAQDYHEQTLRVRSNNEALAELRNKDGVLAAYGKHRFLAYGILRSDFKKSQYRKSLRPETGYDYRERFDCDWTPISAKGDPQFTTSPKARGLQLDLKRGFCVAPTNARTFLHIKARIDQQRKLAMQAEDLESITGEEGKPKGRYGNYFERKSRLRSAAIEIHGENCMVCGFNFGKQYGKRGEGFIEVHHIRLISSHGKAKWVSPSKDMIVVCSNCHRMIHRRKDDVWTAAKLKRRLLNCA